MQQVPAGEMLCPTRAYTKWFILPRAVAGLQQVPLIVSGIIAWPLFKEANVYT